MRYYVRIGLEGLPLHLWSESFATTVIGYSCSLHYAEERSRQWESTEVFKLWAWSADPVAIALRVWLMVLDPNHGGHGPPSVIVHGQRPSKPKHGMVYDVILHVLSIEDTRWHGTDERALFFPFQFNLGAIDVDQVVASAPALAPRGCDMEQGDDRHHAAARHSCLVEYRSPHHRSHDEDDEDTDGTAGVLLPHRGGASSSASVGRQIKTGQGIARQGWNAEKAPGRVGAAMVETDP
jgi:hypothetical protein